MHKDNAHIPLPENVIRGEEVRHSNINVNIPCNIFFEDALKKTEDNYVNNTSNKNNVTETIDGIIYKLNIDEATLRLPQKLSHDIDHILFFNLWNFKMKIITNIIIEKTIDKKDVFYYTVKFKIVRPKKRSVRPEDDSQAQNPDIQTSRPMNPGQAGVMRNE